MGMPNFNSAFVWVTLFGNAFLGTPNFSSAWLWFSLFRLSGSALRTLNFRPASVWVTLFGNAGF